MLGTERGIQVVRWRKMRRWGIKRLRLASSCSSGGPGVQTWGGSLTVPWRAPGSKAGKCLPSSERAWPNPLISQRRKQKAREEMTCPQARAATGGGG